MKREFPCRGPALTAARDVMQKLRADARRVQVGRLTSIANVETAYCCTNESFLVWLDSSFLRLGPAYFPSRRAQAQSRLAAVRRLPAGLALTELSTTADLMGPRLGFLLAACFRRELAVDGPDEGCQLSRYSSGGNRRQLASPRELAVTRA